MEKNTVQRYVSGPRFQRADIVALVEEIRDSEYYISELSYVAGFERKIVGHFLLSKFSLYNTIEGRHGNADSAEMVMLAPVSVHADYEIYPVSGWPMNEPRCQICMETTEGSLRSKKGYVVYDIYYDA